MADIIWKLRGGRIEILANGKGAMYQSGTLSTPKFCSFTHLEIFIKLNLAVHVGVNFLQDVVKFLTGDLSITEALQRHSVTSQLRHFYHSYEP